MKLSEEFFNRPLFCRFCSGENELVYHKLFGDCNGLVNLSLVEKIRKAIGEWIMPKR